MGDELDNMSPDDLLALAKSKGITPLTTPPPSAPKDNLDSMMPDELIAHAQSKGIQVPQAKPAPGYSSQLAETLSAGPGMVGAVGKTLRAYLGKDYQPASVEDRKQQLATAANDVTLGYLPQVAGGAAKITGGEYTSARDKLAQYLKNTPDVNKTMGHVFGLGATEALLSGPTAAYEAASTLSPALKAMVLSGAYGALSNPGDKPGVIDPIQAKERIQNAGNSGLIGLATGSAPAILSKLSNSSSDAAEQAALAHLRPTPRYREALGDRAEAMGREALDSGAIQFGTKVKTTASNLDKLVSELDELRQGYVNDSTKTIDPWQVADRMESEVIAPLRGVSENKPIVDMLENKKNNFLEQYASSVPAEPLSAAQVGKEKSAVYGNINYKNPEAPAVENAKKGWGNVLKNMESDLVTNPDFDRTKDAQGNLLNALRAADRAKSLQWGGLYSHMGDLAAINEAGRAVEGGHGKIGAALALGRLLTRGRGTSSAAVGLDQLSKGLGSASSAASELGANPLPAAVWQRMLQNRQQ